MSTDPFPDPGSPGDRDDDPYRTFRPRFGSVSAWATGVVVVGGCVVVGSSATGPLGTSWVNRSSIAAFASFAAWSSWRSGGVHAVPTREGSRVRNVIYTRRLAWPQIVSVRFGSGDAWVRLDLADGSTLAVMGIQRADGARGEAEARRLAASVKAHGEAHE
ncbi:hypothetical protein OY671_002313 [Metschnikowia pulcherrima]|nr:hypothetical protein OY671_002313 [Metschnikowia pulcherrima]